jgi:hypothetical protein
MEFDTIYGDLAAGLEIIPALLKGVSQAEAQIKPDPESWSLLEVTCHLYDEEREDFRVRLDIILHRPKDPWPPIRPREWVTERKYNQQDLAARLAGFVEERTKSLAWLKGLVSSDWEANCEAPWGVIKAGDMLCSWAAHDNLHTRQLVELRRGRILKMSEPYNVQYAGDW